jgi:hypothetical protein
MNIREAGLQKGSKSPKKGPGKRFVDAIVTCRVVACMLVSVLVTVTASKSKGLQLPEIEEGVSLAAIFRSNLEKLRKETASGHSGKVRLNVP